MSLSVHFRPAMHQTLLQPANKTKAIAIGVAVFASLAVVTLPVTIGVIAYCIKTLRDDYKKHVQHMKEIDFANKEAMRERVRVFHEQFNQESSHEPDFETLLEIVNTPDLLLDILRRNQVNFSSFEVPDNRDRAKFLFALGKASVCLNFQTNEQGILISSRTQQPINETEVAQWHKFADIFYQGLLQASATNRLSLKNLLALG